MRTKKFFYLFAFCTVLSALIFAESFTGTVGKGEEKIYIESGVVHITSSGMFLDLDGSFLPINAITQDENGIFVNVNSAVDITTCPRCGKSYDADNQSKKCPHGWLLRQP